MKALDRALVTPLVLLGFTAVAEATVLYSPPLTIPTSDHRLICRVVNASSTARQINVQLLDSDGNQVGSAVSGEFPPGAHDRAILPSQVSEATAHCRVTVDGGKNTVRAILTIEKDAGLGSFVTIMSAPVE